MKGITVTLWALAAVQLVAAIVAFAVAPWLHGADCFRLVGTASVVLIAACVAAFAAGMSNI